MRRSLLIAMEISRQIAWCTLVVPLALHAQLRAPADGGVTPSLGQPNLWRWSAGASMGAARRANEQQMTSELRGTLARDIGNPLIGLAALQLEAFAGTRSSTYDGGLRVQLAVPFARVAIGADHDLTDGGTRLLLSLFHPTRRGGVFSDGSTVRLDVAPGRDLSIALGIDKPFGHRIPPGATRPASDHVRFSSARARSAGFAPGADARAALADARAALADARAAAAWISEFTVPWLDHPSGNRARAEAVVLAQIDVMRRDLATGATESPVAANGSTPPNAPAPPTLESEVRHFHTAMSRAFATALHPGSPPVDSAVIRVIERRARTVLLDEVLLPYDRLLGQVKDEDTTRELARRARAILLRWLLVESPVPRGRVDDILGVFDGVLGIVEENRAATAARWQDSRFVWLPLQFALLPEEHDTQDELDAIIERAAGERFTGGNAVSYVINEQFQFQLSRTIRAAEDYHVLWVHDVRGVDDGGDPDELTYRHVVGSYLRALTDRVRAYDRTGKLPVYMILLDEWFYQVRGTRFWLDLLEDPLHHRLHLPRGFAAWETAIAAAQDTLRAAVAGSRLLQAQRTQFGEDWFNDQVKVHVNITNTADFTFSSRRVVRGLPVPDNMFRDHRKLVFFDVTEEDPYRGEVIYTGAGVGEHYANLSWEDRALLVRGPAALQVKTAARELLLGQGVDAAHLPWHLQPRVRAADYDEQVQAVAAGDRRTLRALGLHNATGFGRKDVNVGKAVLYTLMPPGSVIKVPDSLWNSAFWSSALVGCSLRGGRVLIIAPSLANAPAPAFGSMEASYEMLWRMLMVSTRLAPELTQRGGLLRVGVFASELEVTDIPGKVNAVQRTFAAHQWLRDLFGFPPSVYAELAELATTLDGLGMKPAERREFESTGAAKLHLKANAFASREAWQLMSRPEWVAMTWEFLQQRIAQVQARSAAVESFDEFPDAILDVGDGTVQRWRDALSPDVRERVVFYSLFGSQNQNARSMVMDGEDALVVSGWPSVIPYLDLISLVGQSRWVDDPAELARLLPPQSALQTILSHWFRLAF